MPSIRRCFLCNYKYDPNNAHIMMHSFPSREDIKKQLIKVCNMLPTDNVTNLFICSKHFQPKDYYKSHSFSTKCKLNIGAIPSRKVVNTMSTGFKGSFDLPSTSYHAVEVHAEVGGTSETSNDLPLDLPSTSFDDGQSTPKKRRFMEPRYIKAPQNAHTDKFTQTVTIKISRETKKLKNKRNLKTLAKIRVVMSPAF